jgi:hypothetical protein
MTDRYRHISTDLITVVDATSYDDAAVKTKEQWDKYAGFSLGAISPIGSPELRTRAPYPHEIEMERMYNS